MDHGGISALIQQLSDAERAQIGIAVLEYTLTGTAAQQMSPALSLAFELIKGRLSAKDNRGGRRSGAGAPAGNTNAKKQSKIIKNSFDCFSPTPPLHTSTDNNYNSVNNINNNINIPSRARKNPYSEHTPAADLAVMPQKQSKQSKFTPPTVEMVAEYCRERRNGIDAQHFVDHYAMRGWIPKGSTRQMTDWKAAIRTWERTGFNKHSPPTTAQTTTANNDPFARLNAPMEGR